MVGDDLHLSYRHGASHTTIASGGGAFHRVKPAGGAWSAPGLSVAHDEHGDDNFGGPTLHPLPNGDLVGVYTSVDPTTQDRFNWYKSRVSGTWGSASAFPNDFPSGQVTSGGAGITLPDGTVLHAVYARVAPSGVRGIYLYERDPDTGTWSQRTPIVVEGLFGNDWEEPSLVRRSDGRVFCFIRDDNTHKIYASYSDDLESWTQPLYVCDGFAVPQVGISPDDDMLLITRHPSDWRAVWSYSNERGRPGSWTPIDYVDSNLGAMMYGAVAWFDDGFVGVYSVAGEFDDETAYTGPADIYEVAFT